MESIKFYKNLKQGSTAWLDLRKTCFTSSIIYNALYLGGRNNFIETYNHLFNNAYRRDFYGNAATEWGHKMEPIAQGAVEDLISGGIIEEVGFVTKGKRMGTSPDGLLKLPGLTKKVCFEFKCPFSKAASVDIDSIISSYWAQCQQHLHVMDYDECYLIYFEPWVPRFSARNFYRPIEPESIVSYRMAVFKVVPCSDWFEKVVYPGINKLLDWFDEHGTEPPEVNILNSNRAVNRNIRKVWMPATVTSLGWYYSNCSMDSLFSVDHTESSSSEVESEHDTPIS